MIWPLTFRVVCADGQIEVTFALALLHGCGPLMFQTLIGRVAGGSQTLHHAFLLTQTTPGRTLTHWGSSLSQNTTKYWILKRLKQKPVLPLPRDRSPSEGGGSAAGYSAPWRSVGHVWGTWTLAGCLRSPRSYTIPHGACSQDHSWAYTVNRGVDEGTGIWSRWEGATAGHCNQKSCERSFCNPLRRGQLLYWKQSQEPDQFLESSLDKFLFCVCHCYITQTPDKSWNQQIFKIYFTSLQRHKRHI